MKLIELLDLEEQLLVSPMHEMANFYPKVTGVPLVIWLGEVGGQHGPRIKVSNTPGKFNKSSNFVVSVSKEPSVLTPRAVDISQSSLDDVLDWVKLNYDVLMELWKMHEIGDGDQQELMLRLKKL